MGSTGLTGSTGPPGVQGYTGMQGSVGPTGKMGLNGYTGLQGVTGMKGDTGNQGVTGRAGLVGPTGLHGMTGPTGDKGNVGPQGPKGDIGPTGTFSTTVCSDIIPCVNNMYNLGGFNGNDTMYWKLIYVNTITSSNELTITGSTTMNGSLDVGGNIYVSGGGTVVGNLSIINNLFVNGFIQVTTSVSIGTDLHVGNIFIGGSITPNSSNSTSLGNQNRYLLNGYITNIYNTNIYNGSITTNYITQGPSIPGITVASTLIPVLNGDYNLGAEKVTQGVYSWRNLYVRNIIPDDILTINGNSTINGNFILNGSVRSNLTPYSLTYTLGSQSAPWGALYTNGIAVYGSVMSDLIPSTENYSLGSPNSRWEAVFSVNGVTSTSDKNDKENIQDCELGLSFVNDLKPVKYNRKGEENKKLNYGIVAQDLEEALDKHKCDDFNGLHTPRNENDKYGINYSQLIPILIKSIQELSQEVADLKAALNK